MDISAKIISSEVEEPAAPRASAIPQVPSLEKLRLRLYLLLVIGDILVLLGSYAMVGQWYPRSSAAKALVEAQIILPLFLTIALYNGTYSARALSSLKTAVARLIIAILLSAGLLNFIAFYLKANDQLSRFVFTLGVLVAFSGMVTMRWAFSAWLHSRLGPSLSNELVIEAGGPHVAMPNAYRIDAAEHHISPKIHDPDGLDRLGQAIRNMDRVIVSCPPQDRADWAFVLRASSIRGEVISDEAHELQAQGVIRDAKAGFSTLIVSTGTLNIRSRAFKRLFDIALALPALIVLSPILFLVAVVIKLSDGGPVLFRQQRTGRANRYFTINKFRTMAVEKADPEGTVSAVPGDRRVTAVGRFLRATSIDELPQLWNVLKNDMSIVGPRPHATGSRAGEKLFWEVDSRYWHRHALKPGLTGLAQIRGLRGATDREEDLSDRLLADLEYISGWSILRDVGIVFNTLRVLVHRKAY